MEQINYKNYYWQDNKIRLRLWNPQDLISSKSIDFDSFGLSLVGEELPLPPEITESISNREPAKQIPSAPSFVIETLDKEFIGHIHFNYINERHGTFSIGLILAPQQRKKEYGTSALKLLLEYAFHERRLNKFNGYCLDGNIGSIALMKKLVCKQEGHVREEVYLGGKFHDRLLFGLTAKEYRDMKNTRNDEKNIL